MFSFFEIGISDRRKKSIPGNSLTRTVQHVHFKARIREPKALIPPSRDGCGISGHPFEWILWYSRFIAPHITTVGVFDRYIELLDFPNSLFNISYDGHNSIPPREIFPRFQSS